MPPKKGKGKGKEKPPAVEIKPAAPVKPKKPPPPPACFTPEQVLEFKELFKAHDEAGVDKITLPMVPLCLRKIGLNPTIAQIKEMFTTILEDEFVDLIEFWEFLLMIEKKVNWGDDIETVVVESLKNLAHDDDETGYVNLEFLKEMLMTWGEPLQEVEFVDWVKLAKKDKTYTEEDGMLKYETFVENMNAKDIRFFPEPINFFKLDQKTLLAMAMAKAKEEAEEQAKKDEEKRLRDEARRQKMIADGLISA